jgi:hypothetical protein
VEKQITAMRTYKLVFRLQEGWCFTSNNCGQNIVFTIQTSTGHDGRAPVNDEVRSVKLLLVPVSKSFLKSCLATYLIYYTDYVIEVFDSPNASENDDFGFIVTKKLVVDYCVGTFEQNVDNEYIQQVFVRYFFSISLQYNRLVKLLANYIYKQQWPGWKGILYSSLPIECQCTGGG